jgi:hypothetical protein
MMNQSVQCHIHRWPVWAVSMALLLATTSACGGSGKKAAPLIETWAHDLGGISEARQKEIVPLPHDYQFRPLPVDIFSSEAEHIVGPSMAEVSQAEQKEMVDAACHFKEAADFLAAPSEEDRKQIIREHYSPGSAFGQAVADAAVAMYNHEYAEGAFDASVFWICFEAGQ